LCLWCYSYSGRALQDISIKIDEKLAQKLSHPKFNHEKTYRIKLENNKKEDMNFSKGEEIA
jgi:hypothetical protein